MMTNSFLNKRLATSIHFLILTIVLCSLMQGRILPLIFFSVGTLALCGFTAFNKVLGKKPVFYLLIYFCYLFINMLLIGGLRNFLIVDFYRYDGKQIFTLAILLFSVAYFLNHDVKSETLLRALFCAGSLMLSMALLFGERTDGFQIAFYSNHNAAAGMAGSVSLVALVYLLFPRTRRNTPLDLLAILSGTLGTMVLMQSGSRAFLVGMIVPITFLTLGKSITRAGKFVILAVALTFVLLSFYYIPTRQRFSVEYLSQDTNLLTRVRLWRKAENFIRHSLLIGVGIGTFNDEYITLQPVFPGVSLPVQTVPFYGENHAHNIILHILAEEGIIGLFLLSLVWISILRRKFSKTSRLSFEAYRMTRTIVLSLFLYVATASLFGNNLLTPSTSFIFYTFAGFYVACSASPHIMQLRLGNYSAVKKPVQLSQT